MIAWITEEESTLYHMILAREENREIKITISSSYFNHFDKDLHTG